MEKKGAAGAPQENKMGVMPVGKLLLNMSLPMMASMLVQACYNIGVKGADVEFSHIYTEAMMKLILSRIQNSWAREKLGVYFQKVNLSGKNLLLSAVLWVKH